MSSHSPFAAPVIGILGGGQLGRMLIQKGLDWNIPFKIMDPDEHAPCSGFEGFVKGAIRQYDDVMRMGSSCDIVTIEIEAVNTSALKDLEKKGTRVYPQPHIIELIQDKRVQKSFYRDHDIPTAPFVLTENQADAVRKLTKYPMVHKLGKDGYDGRGVQVLRSVDDLPKAFDAPGVLEDMVDFTQEISVIVARSTTGELSTFPPVEMVFHPEANLVEYLFAPAQISASISEKADKLARRVIESLEMVGLLAVEMFVTRHGEVLVNEIAPRPHNSGHQTIEGNVTSQYEQHLRAIMGLPLGKTDLLKPSAMVNLLGEPGYTGEAIYAGLEEVLAVEGVYVHLYGKKQTKPFRKMGHVTIVDSDLESLRKKANFVKNTLKVIA